MSTRASLLTATALAVFLQFAGGSTAKLLLWNASASVPIGLYRLRPAHPLRIGELVTIDAPPRLAAFMAARAYLPRGVPLVKHIAALGGQTVCRQAHTITINGHAVAVALERDSLGRPLPAWQGCRRLRRGEVFLLNLAAPGSFDGRYFGVLSIATIAASAEPLWTIEGRSP